MKLRSAGMFALALLSGALEVSREAAAEPRTLRETLEYARDHAPRVEIRAADRDRIRAEARSRGFWLPEPPGVVGEWANREPAGEPDTHDRMWEGSVTIEPFGQGIFRSRAAGAGRHMELSRVDGQARAWAADVAWSYQERQRRSWMHDRTRQQATLSRRLADIVRQRFEAGDASQLEVDLARVEAAEVNGRVLESERALLEAEQFLAAAIGWPAESALPAPDSLELVPAFPDTTGLLARTLEHRPELLVARATLDFANADALLANMQLLPRAEIAAFTGNEGTDDLSGLRVGFSLPFLGPPVADRAARGAEQRRAEAEVRAASREALAAVASTRIAAALAFQEVSIFLQQVLPSVREARQRYQEAYASGQIDLATVLFSEQRYRDGERGFAEALGTYNAALRDLEIATGVPVLSGYELESELHR